MSPRIQPVTIDASPMAMCEMEVLTLKKLPRCRGVALAVIIAMHGTMRPEEVIKNNVVRRRIGPSQAPYGKLVNSTRGTAVAQAIKRKTGSLPQRSAYQPIRVMVISVARPPLR